jgi:hypothetical protein
VRKILRFLELDDRAPIRVRDSNPTVVVRSPRLHELSQAVSLGQSPLARAASSMVKALGSRNVRRAVAIRERLLMGSPRSADDALMLELRQRYKPEVQALSEHLDRDLVTLWGYDRLD